MLQKCLLTNEMCEKRIIMNKTMFDWHTIAIKTSCIIDFTKTAKLALRICGKFE